MKRKILLVDDDDILCQTLAEQLELYDEFIVETVTTVRQAIETLQTKGTDLVLFDVDLPDTDGREAVRLLRKQGKTLPIIMLTGNNSDPDVILGLDSGANDYVTKPFKINVLLAQIRSHLRQHEQTENATFQIGPYLFVPGEKSLLHENDTIRLTEKETAVLRYMLKAPNYRVSKEELLTEVWGYQADVSTHTLETHIYRLRQKIEPDASSTKILTTEPGGYRLAI